MSDDLKFQAAIARLADDKQPILCEIGKFELWCLLSAVQLACRHPKFNGPSRSIIEQAARQLGGAITANDNDLRVLFEMGWHNKFDE